jgi:hypothetical protein
MIKIASVETTKLKKIPLYTSKLGMNQRVFMKLIRTLITSPPTVSKINNFKYIKQTGGFYCEKPPVFILLVFLVFYHIPTPLLQIDKIL